MPLTPCILRCLYRAWAVSAPPPASFFFQSDLQQLLQMFAQAVSIWRNMVANGATLDYPAAAEMIQNSEALSKAFLAHTQKVGRWWG